LSIRTARNGKIELAYEVLGESDGDPLLLVMGLGAQMVGWPDGLCAELVARGFTVVRFDNRDVGLSTHVPPALGGSRLRPAPAYTLADMAADALAVMDDVGWTAAHVAGASMGGMIAQLLAIDHPGRVLSLTSIMSTPSSRIGRMRPRTLLALIRKGRRLGKPSTAEEMADFMAAMAQITGSPAYPADRADLLALCQVSMARDDQGLSGGGSARQQAAIRTAPDRRPGLAGVRVPTLVVHGDSDVLIRPEGGRATAEAVPGARLVTYPGMGHELPRSLWPALADEIRATADLTFA